MTTGPDHGWVEVDAPQWLWGGTMRRYFEEAGFVIRGTREAGTVRVRTEEGNRNARPDLIRLVKALGPSATTNGLEGLRRLADDSVETASSATVEAELSRLGEPDGITEMARYYQLATMGVPSTALPEQADAVWRSLSEVTFSNGEGTAFPHAGVYGIARSDRLLYRMKLMSILLRIRHDLDLVDGDISALKAAHDAGSGSIFASGEDLYSGVYLLDPYVSVLVGATSPGLWGFLAFRGRGPVIYSFGQQVAGTSDRPSDLFSTLHVPGAEQATEFEQWDADVVPAALTWWANALNDLFGVLSDWSVFRSSAGKYMPTRHLETAATVEQLFRRVLSVLVNHHDANARRVLLFTVLDTLQSLTGLPIEKTCEHRFAVKTLRRLRQTLPVDAQPLLLAGAARGVQALERLQDGFFLAEHTERVKTRPSTGRSAPKDMAAAQYLKVLRDATHGHDTTKAGRIEVTRTLLATHDGRVPHDVPMLGWLYLLSLMSQPAALRNRLADQCRRTD